MSEYNQVVVDSSLPMVDALPSLVITLIGTSEGQMGW